MFFVRGALVCISMFVVAYACTSLAIACGWRKLGGFVRSGRPRRLANTLFAARVAPLAAGIVAVAAFAAPSFAWYEPRGEAEAIGAIPIVLAAVFLLIVVSGSVRAWLAVRRTKALVRRWTCVRSSVQVSGAVVVSSPDAPPVALAGISSSTLLISAAARSALTPAEMQRAIAHENSHRRAADNLKKLLLKAIAFPGMTALEGEWLRAIELSADDDAVESRPEALDLASALVKIARLHGTTELPALASGLVDGARSTLEIRVERLMHWEADASQERSGCVPMVPGVVALLLVACAYPQLLHGIHLVTELLVR